MTKKLHKRKQLLIDTLSVQTSSGQEEQMIRYIINFCITNVPSAKIEVDSNNIYVTKGSSDILEAKKPLAPELGSFVPDESSGLG